MLIYLILIGFQYNSAANAQLQLIGGDAFINTRVLLNCTLPSAATVVTWHSSDKSNNYETVAVIQEFSNGRCSQSPNSNLTCTCNFSLFTCAINSVNLSNDGQRWRCSASINSATMYSNTHTIRVLSKLLLLLYNCYYCITKWKWCNKILFSKRLKTDRTCVDGCYSLYKGGIFIKITRFNCLKHACTISLCIWMIILYTCFPV